jgi:hypothetical protein
MAAATVLEDRLPPDLVDDIMLRVHRLNMRAVLEGVRDPRRVLASYPSRPIEEWIDRVDEQEDIQCISSKSVWRTPPNNWMYPYFAREVQRVVHVDNEYFVGQMDWGAWFVHGALPYNPPTCMLAEDVDEFVRMLPDNLKRDLSLS